MKKEMKFRAWDLKNKQWLWANGALGKHYTSGNVFKGWELNIKEGVVLMQYIGLTDKNGKEIYEGDIVKMLDEWIGHYKLYSEHTIEFGAGTFRLENGIPLYDCLDEDCDFERCAFEIIGNIYENPKLLNNS